MLHMKKFNYAIFLLLLSIVYPSHASIDVKLKGSVSSEITALPGDSFYAGHRTRLYSELKKAGKSESFYARLWFFNQKAGKLSRYDAAGSLYTENLIDWVELKLAGPLTSKGPNIALSVGNFELDYSPYTISLRDNAVDEYGEPNKEYRGVAVKDLNLIGCSCTGFSLWGFEKNSSKNMLGTSISRNFNNTKINYVVYDFSDRTDLTAEKVRRASKGERVGEDNKLIWEQLTSFELEQSLGKIGKLNWLIVDQEQVKDVYTIDILKDAKLQILLAENEKLFVGYRDVPLNYDPLLRDKTPEFDTDTGYYLGYNPVDRYRDRAGFYTGVSIDKPTFSAKVLISALKEHGEKANRYLTNELSFSQELNRFNYELFSKIDQTQRWSNTQVSDVGIDKFCRFTVKKKLPVNTGFIIPGAQIRHQDNEKINNTRLSLFLQYESPKLMKAEAGIRYRLNGDDVGGRYWIGFNYQAPNGLVFLYRYTYLPEHSISDTPSDGKKYYDPDYSILEQDNIVQMSAKITF